MLPVSEILQYITTGSDSYLKKGTEGHKIRYTANQPPVVVWNITNQCNMACPHCYSAAKFKAGPEELSLEEAFAVVDNLQAAKVKILIFSGGEPLLRSDWPEIVKYARAAGMITHLSTNGVLVTKEVATQLKGLGVNYVGISLDGLPEFNDPYRKYEHAYDEAVVGIKNALAAGIMTGIRITVSSKNEDQLFPLLEQAAVIGASRFYISHLVYGGRGIGFARQDQERKHNARQMEQLFTYALENMDKPGLPLIVTGGNDADCVALYLFIKEKLGDAAASKARELLEKRGGNSAGEKMINIDHKGDVHPDQFWRSVSPGNIKDHPLNELLSMGIMAELPNRINLLKGRCATCVHKKMCRGSHRERAEIVHGDVWAEDPACYITDEQIAG